MARPAGATKRVWLGAGNGSARGRLPAAPISDNIAEKHKDSGFTAFRLPNADDRFSFQNRISSS